MGQDGGHDRDELGQPGAQPLDGAAEWVEDLAARFSALGISARSVTDGSR